MPCREPSSVREWGEVEEGTEGARGRSGRGGEGEAEGRIRPEGRMARADGMRGEEGKERMGACGRGGPSAGRRRAGGTRGGSALTAIASNFEEAPLKPKTSMQT